MTTPSLKEIKSKIYADMISKDREGNYVFRKGYFYRPNYTPYAWSEEIVNNIRDAFPGSNPVLVNTADHWAAFKGGASLAKSSHFKVTIFFKE